MTIEVRAVIHFLYFLNLPDEDILAKLDSAYGESIVDLKTVRLWTSTVRTRKTNLDDEPWPGRPRQNRELLLIRTMIDENVYLFQKNTAQILSIGHDILKSGWWRN
jgi:hypothetical protein